MFNQKVNGYTSQNPDYLNSSLGAPGIRALDIHNCGTTISKYTKSNKCADLPLQTWCSPNSAVESFAMRPIVNSKDYFENINKYLAGIIYSDSVDLKNSKLSSENYILLTDFGIEPQSSFLQAIRLETTNRIMYLMGDASNKVKMFNEYNPLCEGLILLDIEFDTYQSKLDKNHFYHKILFSVVNTTRYNTIAFKAEVFQDTTPMMEQWDKNINEIEQSKNVSSSTTSSIVYVANINLLNNLTCVLGQESDCEFKGYNFNSSFSQLLNDNLLAPVSNINWVEPNSITDNNYTSNGNYDTDGKIKITDTGPSNIDQIINSFKGI
jgi:hypothetical protein